MNKYLILFSFLFLACNNNSKTSQEATEDVIEAATEVSTNTTDTLCFILTKGTKNQDTNAIKLAITNNDVAGKMLYMPDEKDWRIGNLTGKKDGDIFNLVWTYMQEGMKDSVQVVLKMNGDKILQKPSSYDGNTGKEFIADTAQFRVAYYSIDCAQFPRHDFDLGM